MRCDCEDEGRDAYKYERYSYETQERINSARYGYGDECDREFLDGYKAEERRAEEERAAEEAREERYAELRRQQAREEEAYYEQQMGYEQ